jgi:hypothetical protein
MKKTLHLLITILCIGNLNAQTFTEHHVFDETKITGPHETGHLIDFDGDGDEDLLVTDGYNRGPETSRQILVFVNDGTDMDSLHVLYTSPFGLSTSNFEVGDFDNDNDPDIIFNVGSNFYVLENLGSGNFANPIIHTTPSLSTGIWWLGKGDYDNDGLVDILFATPNALYWCESLGGLSFQSPVVIFNTTTGGLAGNVIRDITPSNFDGDSDLDFVVYTKAGGPTLLAAINDGNGNFSFNIIHYWIGASPNSYAVEDFNGDGFKDIGLANRFSDNNAIIYWNDQTNNFPTSTVIDSHTNPPNSTSSIFHSGFYAFDYDNDNDQDVLVCLGYGNQAGGGKVFLNDGSGSFTYSGKTISNTSFSATQSNDELVNEVFTTDVNSDGRLDFITSSNQDGDIILHTQNVDSTYNSNNYLNHYMAAITRIQYMDMDADGIKDVITIDAYYHGKANVSYNDGNGTFISQNKLGDNLAYNARDVVFTDWDNDGNLDKIFTSSNKVAIHSNYNNSNADSLFVIFVSDNTSPYGNVGTDGNTMHALRLGDIDNDGDNDLIIAESEGVPGTKVHWVENTLNLTYTTHLLISTKVSSYEIGDMDGDNDLDFVSIEHDPAPPYNRFLKTYTFDLNTKTFGLNQDKPVHNELTNFVLADPDNDNDLDIVYSSLMWFENTDGLGALADYAPIVGAFNQYGIIISGDINDDGLEDFVVTNNHLTGTDLLVLYKNLGGNTFSTSTIANDFAFGSKPALIADVDYDGIKDIITYEREVGSNRPKWYRTCFPTTSSITETACASYTSPSGNYTWSVSDIYTDTISNTAGCDSVITIDLTVNLPASNTVNTDVCYGSSYTYSDLTVVNNLMANETHVSTLVGLAANGCDSIITENLTVLPELTGTNNTTICANESVVINGTTYDAANSTGTEVFSGIGPNSCDSAVTVALTIESAIDVSVANAPPTLTANQTGATYRWLDCNNSNLPIQGETGVSYTATSNGNYAVEITVGNCVDTSSCYTVTTVGISDMVNEAGFMVYPNPNNGQFTIAGGSTDFTIEIHNAVGQLLLSQQAVQERTELNLQQQPSGIYHVSVIANKEVSRFKLVKQ